MPTILEVLFILYLFVVLYGGHVLGKSNGCTAGGVYDITEYGAAPSSQDDKDAFLAAWHAACGSTAGKHDAPGPRWHAIEFSGPCKNGDAPVVLIDGVLQPCAGGCHLSDDAWITFSGLNNLLLTGAGTLDGQGGAQTNKPKSKTTTLEFDGVASSTVRGLTFVDSRGFHVGLQRSSRVAAECLHIHAPQASRNTDGIHIGLSSHVCIANSVIGIGDEFVSVGHGSTDVVVRGVICGPGRGVHTKKDMRCLERI